MTAMGPRSAHLVGRVGLDGAEDVFTEVSAALGDRVTRIPDGETGDRQNWIAWQYPVLAATAGLEECAPAKLGGYDAGFPQVRLAGTTAVQFGPLGYADAARSSYELFRTLKGRGVVPESCRFQVSLPTPLATTAMFVDFPDQPVVERAYERRMLEELGDIARIVPHDELAVQWDVAVEIALLENVWKHRFDDAEQEIVDRLARIGQHLPEAAQLGYHLCYGNKDSRHFIEPTDTGLMTRVAQRIADTTARPVHWVHMPVPIARDDDAYFRPLADLRLDPGTELFLGLVHLADGVEGGHRRIATARKFVSSFGVAGECGFPSKDAATVAEWLRLHASLTASQAA